MEEDLKMKWSFSTKFFSAMKSSKSGCLTFDLYKPKEHKESQGDTGETDDGCMVVVPFVTKFSKKEPISGSFQERELLV